MHKFTQIMWVACGLLPIRRWDAASRIVSKFWEGLGQSRDEPPVKIQSHLVTMTSLFQETSLHFINQPFKCLNRIIAAHRSFYININDNLGAGRRPENYPLDGWDQQMLPLQLNWKSDNIFVIFLPWTVHYYKFTRGIYLEYDILRLFDDVYICF